MFRLTKSSVVIIDTTPVQSAIWSAFTNMRCTVINQITEAELAGIDAASVRIVLIDDQINNGNGIVMIPTIRSRFKNARIIATSFNPNAGVTAYLNGADLFFEKPFDWDRMNTAIRRVLDGTMAKSNRRYPMASV